MANAIAIAQNPRLGWCFQPLTSPSRLREIYLTLDKRETDRRSKTISKSENPYSAHEAYLGPNRIKNRYNDIYPYDVNRIRLPNPIDHSDYVNASYVVEPDFGLPLQPAVPGLSSLPRGWIASQGPLRETCYDFLSLLLHPDPTLRPRVVIQLTACTEGGREKSSPYIPATIGASLEFQPYCPARKSSGNETSRRSERFRWVQLDGPDRDSYGFIRVTLESSVPGPVEPSSQQGGVVTSFYRKNSLLIESFGLGSGNSPAGSASSPLLSQSRVTHFECVDWPDRGVPTAVDPMIELISAANASSLRLGEHDSPPILVHCSAGVGRTGTLIAIASCMARFQVLADRSSDDNRIETMSEMPAPLPTQDTGRLSPLPSDLDGDLVARTIDYLREQRVRMVQTEGQLGFVYKAAARILLSRIPGISNAGQ